MSVSDQVGLWMVMKVILDVQTLLSTSLCLSCSSQLDTTTNMLAGDCWKHLERQLWQAATSHQPLDSAASCQSTHRMLIGCNLLTANHLMHVILHLPAPCIVSRQRLVCWFAGV